MATKREVRLETGRIPVNYTGYFHIMGFSVSQKGVYEGIVMALLMALILFVLHKLFLPLILTLYFGFFLVICAFVAGCIGWNGGRFSTFVINAIKHFYAIHWNKTSLIALFNPRVKKEELEKEKKETVYGVNESAAYAKNNATRWLLEWKEKHMPSSVGVGSVSTQTAIDEAIPDSLFFEEDVNIVKAPKEYIVKLKSEDDKKSDTTKKEKEKSNGKKKKKKANKKRRKH